MCTHSKFLVILVVLTTTVFFHSQTDSSTLPFRIKSDHPRLYFNKERLNEIRIASGLKFNSLQGRKGNVLASAWSDYEKTADDFATKILNNNLTVDVTSVHPYSIISVARSLGLAYMITHDVKLKTAALKYADALMGVSPKNVGGDYTQAGRVEAMGIIYDWLFDEVSSTISTDGKTLYRDALANAILETIQVLEHDICGPKAKVVNWGCNPLSSNPDYISGHSHQNNTEIVAGLLAIVDEHPEIKPLLLAEYDNFIKGYNPARAWISIDGGHHMGWSYGAGYTFLDSIQLWQNATNASMLDSWQGNLIYPYIYGLRGDSSFPVNGDAFKIGLSHEWLTAFALWSSNKFSDPYATNFYNRYILPNKSGHRFNELMYWQKATHDSSIENLDYSRWFRNSGQVVVRDSWDYPKATLLEFKSSSFYSINHQHLDQNSFTMFYKSPLLVDSGFYDAYGTTHWKNYYTRTIAHNAVVVYDPEERFERWGISHSNDGGESFKRITEPTLQQIQKNGSNNLDGIMKYEYSPDVTYVVGNASKAYDPLKMDQENGFIRSIIFLRKPLFWDRPVTIVFDKVKTRPEKAFLKKTFLLHMVNEPEPLGGKKVAEGQYLIQGNLVIIRNREGMLFSQTLIPEKPDITKIGGKDQKADYRFLVRNSKGNYENYRPDPAKQTPSNPATGLKLIESTADVGAWRIEVSSQEARQLEYFLHVFSVSDNIPSAQPPNSSNLSSATAAVALIGSKQIIAFAKDDNPSSYVSWDTHVNDFSILVAGLLPSEYFTVKSVPNDKNREHPYTIIIMKDQKGGLMTSRQGLLKFDLNVNAAGR